MDSNIAINKRSESLQPGEIIARTVTDATGQTLFEKGLRLSAANISRLVSSGITSVTVLQPISEQTSPQGGTDETRNNYTFIGVSKDDVYDAAEGCLRIDSRQAAELHEGITAFAVNVLTNIGNPDGLDMDSVHENVANLLEMVDVNPAAMISLVHLRDLDRYTFMHSVNVSILALLLGRRLGLDRAQLELLGSGSILHDVGKTLVSQEILNKPGKLSENEFLEMKAHSQRGYEILRKRGSDEQIARIALMHHEKLNGHGYPLGLKAEKVPLLARIVTIVDIYDALTADRVYKKAMHPSQAFGIIEKDTEEVLDPSLFKIFKTVMGTFPVSSQVLLANGSIARVIAQSPADPDRPVVEIVANRYGQTLKERIVVNTSNSAEYAITGIHVA